MRWLLLFALFTLSLPVSAAIELYVAPQGNDAWSGRLASPNAKRTDGPFATPERARDAVRGLRQGGKSPGKVTVWVRGGTYYRDKPFELTAADGGTPTSPVAYCAYGTETPRWIGGKAIPGWQPVTDPAVRERLPQNSRAEVREVDLRKLGITDYGALTRRGFPASTLPPMELFYAEKVMTLARWPNDGWAKITSVPEGQNGGVFGYEGDRPAAWKDREDIWAYGYWTFDWADSFEKIAAIDTQKHTVRTVPPHGTFGYTAGKRFYFLNILEELDAPGEYYIDRAGGKLYFYPPSPAQSTSEAFVSTMTGPILSLNGVSNVTVSGLTFEGCRGDAVVFRGGSNNRIAGCLLRNIGQVAVRIGDGATDSGVQSCDIYGTGDGGIVLDGGDRKTLTSGRLFADNNEIHHTGRLRRTYTPAISPNGVGCRVSHNRIHDLPHTAIQGGGNDHITEYNEIYRVCQETGDAGAFYMGRDFSQRGNIVRFNHFHDLRAGNLSGQTGFTEVMGVYLDDCFSGVTVYGNLFVRAGRSAMIGGGRDNTIENNIFVDGSPAVHVDSRGKSWAAKYFVDNGEWHIFENLARWNPTQPPYSVRYPQLVRLREDDPALAKGNRILRNISVGGKWREMQDGLDDKLVLFEENYVGTDPGFVDAGKGDYRLKADSPVWKLGFKPLPYGEMGLRKDSYRKTAPRKD